MLSGIVNMLTISSANIVPETALLLIPDILLFLLFLSYDFLAYL